MDLPDADPAWLNDARRSAAERFEASALPTSASEVWRYSRIDSLDLAKYGTPAPSSVPMAAPALPVAQGLVAATVVIRDGRVESIQVSDAASAAGLSITRLAEVSGAVNGPVVDGGDPMVDLAVALAADGLVVDVARNSVIAGTIHVVNALSAEGAIVATRCEQASHIL